jgi:hypothetical protein
MISFYGPGVMPDRQELANGLEVNADGAGFGMVIPGDGMLTWKHHKDMTMVLDMFMTLRGKYPDGPAVFHSRAATASKVSLSNAHPVPVGGDPETLFFHNGDLSGVMDGLKRGESDTAHFADNVLAKLDLDNPVHAEAIENVISSTGSKAVILTSHPRYAEPAYLYNRSQWLLTPQGALHSNADYLGRGKGWNEQEDEAGDLHRWSVLQEGQCSRCYRYGHGEMTCTAPRAASPFRWRNESKRRRDIAALTTGHRISQQISSDPAEAELLRQSRSSARAGRLLPRKEES